jgi:DNA mismatch endonuclease, patch repair protein
LRLVLRQCRFFYSTNRHRSCVSGGMRYDSRGHDNSHGPMDTLTRAERSKRMALIRSKNTKPEVLVRKIAHSCGYRFRSHVSDLPGKPDLVFPRRKKVIFVHGCFWHRHPGCALARLPKSKLRFWIPKLTENRRRDLRNIARLRRANWSVSVVWECQLKNPASLERKIRRFLEAKR